MPTFTTRFKTRIHLLDIGDTRLEILAPENPDTLLDDPVVEARYKADDYMPYWPIIWPSGLMMAKHIQQGSSSPPALPETIPGDTPRCIDLGCGLGITGIAAAQRGWQVTFTDYDPEAIEFAHYNALKNGVPAERIRCLHMDWRQPLQEKFDWIVASDVLYERRLHPLLLQAVSTLLSHRGTAWISDPQRSSAENFPLAAVEAGFRCNTVRLEGKDFAGAPQPGTLYVLNHAPVKFSA